MKRVAIAAALIAAVHGCAADEPAAEKPRDLQACAGSCGGDTFYMDGLDPLLPSDDGRIFGWDLDERVSDEDDVEGCRKTDYVGLDGTVGVDNQMAAVLKEVIGATGEAFPSLLANAVREGGISLLFEFVDGGKALAIRRGGSAPLLGTDNKILPGQTFELHDDYWLGGTTKVARTADGQLEYGPFALKLPAVVFGIYYQITLVDARMRVDYSSSGTDVTGYVGGSFKLDDIYTIADTIVVPEIGDLVRAIVPPMADIRSPDTRQCDRISIGARVHGLKAFTFPKDVTE